MNLYACLVHSRGEPVDPASRAGIEQYCVRRGLEYEWFESGAVSVLWTRSDHAASPAIARLGSLVAVGVVRLENREEIARRNRRQAGSTGDLELVLSHYRRFGSAAIRDLIGDFSIVIADGESGRALGARDAFGVRTLFWKQFGDVVAFSSRAEALATPSHYDRDYLIEFLAGTAPALQRTPFTGVSTVPPASIAIANSRSLTVQFYWCASEFECTPVRDERTAVDEFRSLLTHAVQLCVTDDGRTWSELSGGLDSSSIVSIAETLKRDGLSSAGVGGTITYADSVGAGSDERRYSDCVVKAFRLRNEVLCDFVPLQRTSDTSTTDTPDVRYLLAARDVATGAMLRTAGARVLLSGIGCDHYLVGNLFHFADWIANGRWKTAMAEMLRVAAIGRVSFWKVAYLNALLPSLPAPLRLRLLAGARVPRWVPRRDARRLHLSERSTLAKSYSGRRGHQYADEVAYSTQCIASGIDHGILADTIAIRYPFCHRPLVEFALRLPVEFCRRPNERKWILREAMRSCLPESIRTRRWKGSFDGRVAWTLRHDAASLEPLVTRSQLAELGCVDVSELRTALRNAAHVDRQHERIALLNVFALESWLQARSGRWTTQGRATERSVAGVE